MTIAEKHELKALVVKILSDVKQEQTKLQLDYDRWAEEQSSSISSFADVPEAMINTTYSENKRKLDLLESNVDRYNELVTILLIKYGDLWDYSQSLNDINKDCAVFKTRLKEFIESKK